MPALGREEPNPILGTHPAVEVFGYPCGAAAFGLGGLVGRCRAGQMEEEQDDAEDQISASAGIGHDS